MSILAKLTASLFWSIVVGLLAKRKNLNFWGWGIAGAASWFIALVFLAFQPYKCAKCKSVVEKNSITANGCMTCAPSAGMSATTKDAIIDEAITSTSKAPEPSLVQTLLMPVLFIGAFAVVLYFVYRPSDRSATVALSSQSAPNSIASKKQEAAVLPLTETQVNANTATTAKQLKDSSNQSLPVIPTGDFVTKRPLASSADELEKRIVQIMKGQLKSGTILTKSDHTEFWILMNQLTTDEQSQVIKIARVNLAQGIKLNLALLDSALISASHGKVVKTADYIEANSESRKVFLTTLPATLTPTQREAALREYEARRLIAEQNNEDFLRSAAAGSPHKVSEGHFIATDVNSLRGYGAPMQQSMLRLNRLLSPTWKDEVIEEQPH